MNFIKSITQLLTPSRLSSLNLVKGVKIPIHSPIYSTNIYYILDISVYQKLVSPSDAKILTLTLVSKGVLRNQIV